MVTVARRPVCPVTLTPGDPALASVRDLVDAWSAHDALAELVTMFGGAFPQTDHLEARLASLDKFSTAWDYRARARAARALHGEPVRCQDSGGGARWLIPRLDLPAKKRDAIVGLAQQLGLTLESTPQGTTFDHVLVIGTGRHSNLIRARWARELAKGRQVGHIVLAAASRRLLPSEDDAVAVCAPAGRQPAPGQHGVALRTDRSSGCAPPTRSSFAASPRPRRGRPHRQHPVLRLPIG